MSEVKKENKSIKEQINEIMAQKLTLSTKADLIKCILVEDMNKTWFFIKEKNNQYYFDSIESKLYTLKSSNFNFFLYKKIWIIETERIFKLISQLLSYYILENWRKVKIKKFSFFDKDTNILYIHTWWIKVIKISSDKIEEINNWNDWVLFRTSKDVTKWDFIKDKNLLSNKNYIEDFLNSINFSKNKIKKEDFVFLLKHYLYSLFFPDLLANRPILIFLWEKGAWKSYFFQILLQIFYWELATISNIPPKVDDLQVVLQNDYINVFDNVDNKLSDTKIDILCSVATGIAIKARKLYSNLELVNTKINAFLWLTSRTPKFVRDDLMDRSIIINLDRRINSFTSSQSSKDKYLKNRDEIMTLMCYDLQNLLWKLEDYKDYVTKFRMSDFSNFLLNLNKDKEEYVNNLFENLTVNQQRLVNNDDDLLILLNYIIDDSRKKSFLDFTEWNYYTTTQLHKIFSRYKQSNSNLVSYNSSSVKSLWKMLNMKKESYEKLNGIKIDVVKCASNIRKYCITKKS